MPNASGSKYVVAVESGSGVPSEKLFAAGTEVAPFSVGSAGMWRVTGEGIADVHGFLYFDGESLFVQSAGTRFVVSVDGRRVGTEWSPVRAPCRIQMGGVVLRYQDAADDEGETIASAHPPVQRPSRSAPVVTSPSARPFKPGEFASVSEDGATRVQDISTGSKSIGRQPSAPSRASAPPILQGPDVPAVPGPVSHPPSAPLTHVQPGLRSTPAPGAVHANPVADGLMRARAAFNAMSMPMKLSAAGIPIVLMLVFMMPTDPPPRPKRLGGDAGATLSRDGGAVIQDAGIPVPVTALLTAPDALVDGGPIVEFNADGDSGTVRLAPGKKTDERQAIDKAAAGKYLEAASLYEQLARENPTKPAYAEAAKIMRARAGATTR